MCSNCFHSRCRRCNDSLTQCHDCKLKDMERAAEKLQEKEEQVDWSLCPKCGEWLFAVQVYYGDIYCPPKRQGEYLMIGEQSADWEQIFAIECSECDWRVGAPTPPDIVPQGMTLEKFLMREHVKAMIERGADA